MKNSIYPCLTLKGKVAEAADFYIRTFGEGKILQTNPFVIQIELSGQKFMLLNDGPTSLPNPSISFMVISDTEKETEQYWNTLLDGGKVMMPLGSYDWSAKYGWIADKYGVSWQLFTGNRGDSSQKFSPCLMFIEANAGKATEAIHFYTQLFPGSEIQSISNYGEGAADNADFIKHGQFKLKDFILRAMDSSAKFDFELNDAISLVVECDTQQEIDLYWNALTAHGGLEIACGWLVDKYGVSWQIVPQSLGRLMKDPERGQRVMNALMKMKKLIISDLENA